jgi:hypothetical protein
MAAILPLAETVVLGAADGALRAADVKAGRTSTFSQWSTWLEAGLVAAGALAAMQRVHADWWEPAVVGGLFALSQRGGAMVSHQMNFGAAGFIGGPGRAGVARAMASPLPGWGRRPYGGPDPMAITPNFPAGQHVLPAGVMG